jgi:hypothetical protein
MCWTAPGVPGTLAEHCHWGGHVQQIRPSRCRRSFRSRCRPWRGHASQRRCRFAPWPVRTSAPGQPVQALPAWLVRPRPHPADHEEGCRPRVVPFRLLPAGIAIHAEVEQRAHQCPRAPGCARPRHRDPHRPRRLPLPWRARRINRTSGDQTTRVSRLVAEIDVLRRQRTRRHLRRLSAGSPQRTQTAVSTGSVSSSPSGPDESSTDPGGSSAGSVPVLTSTVTSPRR